MQNVTEVVWLAQKKMLPEANDDYRGKDEYQRTKEVLAQDAITIYQGRTQRTGMVTGQYGSDDEMHRKSLIRAQLLSFTMFIREYAEFIRQVHKSVAVLALCISGRDFCARAGPALWFYHEQA